ncbi:MAG TPA: alpha/beta fold hydrolase [Mycobacteriales bacterium]|jgi:pimeloyl-ACP methyl ester carboxylesterase
MLTGVRREASCLLRAVTGLPTVLGDRTPRLTELPSAGAATITTPVILVHGYLGTGAGWAPLVRSLHRAGVGNVFVLRYDAFAAGVPAAAAALVAAATTAMARAGRPGVHLVGHSLGGVVVRYAVQHLGLDAVTRSVLTVAAPHQGTWLARFGPGPSAAALRPGSPILAALPPLESTPGVRWAAVHAGTDVVVGGRRAAGGTSVPAYGHLGILRAPELGDAVLAHLASGEDDVDGRLPALSPAG